jgi:phosphoenolpyruvate-protein kinase (PTS system EI component)
MIETPTAVRHAREIAQEADFLSIGTNDLVATTLSLDRGQPVASVRAAADPRVLRHVATVVRAARDSGRTVEVCGEAASDLTLAALFVGLGVDELSVGPARLDDVRAKVRTVTLANARLAVQAALHASSADEALALAEAQLAGDAHDERRDALHRVGGPGA